MLFSSRLEFGRRTESELEIQETDGVKRALWSWMRPSKKFVRVNRCYDLRLSFE